MAGATLTGRERLTSGRGDREACTGPRPFEKGKTLIREDDGPLAPPAASVKGTPYARTSRLFKLIPK